MLKLTHKKTANLLLIAGLVILSLFLAACQTDSEQATNPVGLRPEAVADLVEVDASDTADAADPVPGDAADPVEEQVTVPATTGGARGNGGQARLADRTEHIIDPDTAEPGADEIAGLVYMREEEKLARDVYLTLYDLWGTPIFQNIAGSEQAHMDSVLMIMEQYGLSDPAAGMDVGQFNDPFFQSLYEELVAQGRLFQTEALLVGASIEELDIVDLEERLAQASNATIIQVYTNLLAGSENHLRSFVSNYERQSGQGYQPVYLDQAAYQAIIAGAAAQGNGNGGYGGGNGTSSGGGGYRGGNGSSGGNGRQYGRNNGA